MYDNIGMLFSQVTKPCFRAKDHLVYNKYRLLHRKCDVRIYIHELQNFGKRISERSERVSFSKFCNSWI